jgi:hypothetical protein
LLKKLAVETRVNVKEQILIGEDLNDPIEKGIGELLLVVEVVVEVGVLLCHVVH